jgi:hypothetical protein
MQLPQPRTGLHDEQSHYQEQEQLDTGRQLLALFILEQQDFVQRDLMEPLSVQNTAAPARCPGG